jgi:hypothetical protein
MRARIRPPNRPSLRQRIDAIVERLVKIHQHLANPVWPFCWTAHVARHVAFGPKSSPFQLKDALKCRGDRWSDGFDGHPRAWYADVDESNLESELRAEIYQRETEIAHHAINTPTRI